MKVKLKKKKHCFNSSFVLCCLLVFIFFVYFGGCNFTSKTLPLIVSLWLTHKSTLISSVQVHDITDFDGFHFDHY